MKEFAVSLQTSEGAMDLHAFIPDGNPALRLPAVIVLQEAFGVNAHMKRVCRRVASLGYAAFCPELFHRTGQGLQFGYDDLPRVRPILGELNNDRILEDLRVAHRHVILRPDVDASRVASWGFCMGGWASVLAACELPISASIAFYGGGLVRMRPGIGFTPLVDRLGSIRCPILLVYGAKDTGIPPEDIAAVQTRLASQGTDHEVEVYPNGGHGFFCDERASYDRDSAEASWTRATAWLAAKLG
jgi:carboxymethylenebutenolidase